jgi:hypothetical protein
VPETDPGARGTNVERALVYPKPHVVIDRHAELSPF